METHCAIKRGKRRRRAESIGKFAKGERERERESEVGDSLLSGKNGARGGVGAVSRNALGRWNV